VLGGELAFHEEERKRKRGKKPPPQEKGKNPPLDSQVKDNRKAIELEQEKKKRLRDSAQGGKRKTRRKGKGETTLSPGQVH